MEVISSFQLEYTVIDSDTYPCAAIIVAAGNATRMGGEKQFLSLRGIPVLARTLMAFEKASSVRDIIVVARENDLCDVQHLAEIYHISKLKDVVVGGAQRQDSVSNGLKVVQPDVVYVAIHDGARPLITPEQINQVILDAGQTGAAALGVPVKDTIKQADESGCIESTVPRDRLFAIQTPQVFDVSVYRKALQQAIEQKLSVTDDCMICEAAGYPVVISNGSYRNLKITTAEDVAIAEVLLCQEEQHD